MGLNSLQNTAAERNLGMLKRLNFGTDQMLETSKKSLGLKTEIESRRLHEDCKTKTFKNVVNKMRLLNISS